MAPQSEDILNENDISFEENICLKSGKKLAAPEQGEEIVISGLSGRYPDSRNVHHFRDNLFNKVDMVSDDNRRWNPGHPEIPQRTGKIYDIEKHDPSFFGMHYRQANEMDPLCRLFLEVAIEAIFDAGINPADLQGTNTGVFVGACFSESEKTWFYDKLSPGSLALTGCDRSMIPNRVSYYLKLKGPSMTCDTACSSSLYALDHAYRAIRTAECDNAIVGGTNLCLSPSVSLQFGRLGVLGSDGACKAFDNSGNGYARSETISAIFLQKSKEAKRIYATILHVKTNCDGFKDSGITFPSRTMQVRLLKEFYEECQSVKPYELSFLEAHGTGTKVGDPEELQAIEEVFLPGRKSPLLIGSVKSNIGHTEPSSGLCSVTKVLIGLETGYIPPNLHYNTPREGIKSLVDGMIKVVADKTEFKDDRGLIGINSFGFGGGNCHVLLRHNPKKKVNQGKPLDNIPRLICVSGRTPDAVNMLLDSVIENKLDVEHIRLLQDIFSKNVKAHYYRGYALASKSGQIARSQAYFDFKKVPLLICFGIIDETTRKRAKEFLEVPDFTGVLEKVHQVLKPKNVSIMNIILKDNTKSIFETILANVTIQLAICNLIKTLEIKPSKIFGVNKDLSLGSLICAYFDGGLSLEEVIELAYVIGSIGNAADKSSTAEFYDLIQKDKKAASDLKNILDKIITKPRKLSNNVIFDQYPAEIDSCFIVNSLKYTDVSQTVKDCVTKKCIIFEVGNGQMSTLLNSSKKSLSVISRGGLNDLLVSIGRLYELGVTPQLQYLYPKVQYPVSKGTPMISPTVGWKHDKNWYVTRYSNDNSLMCEQRAIGFSIKRSEDAYLTGHVVDGRNLFPAMGYLLVIWEALARTQRLLLGDMKVVFENCRFIRACSLSTSLESALTLHICLHRESGMFEICEGDSTVVTGRIRIATGNEADITQLPLPPGVPNNIAPYMSNKDVYKELRLRGYNYKGKFRGIQSCDVSGQVASIVWDNNWITFMDNMLQVKILQEDTRLLYVPTTISRLSIDAKKHMEIIQSLGENPNAPVYACKHTGVIQSGGIEIRGLIASSIPRRKNMGIPVLEKYVPVPNATNLKLEQAVRVNMQILLENAFTIQVKAVELIDEATPEENKTIGDIVFDVLADQPVIQPNITVLSKTELEVNNVTVEDKKLLTEVDCHLVIASRLFERPNIFMLALGSLHTSGFILSRESLDLDHSVYQNDNVSIMTVYTTDKEKLIFMKKVSEYKSPAVLEISALDTEFSWLQKLRALLEKEENILLYSEKEPLNGLLGLYSCLRREPGGQKIKLLFVLDPAAPVFDVNCSFYESQLKKQLFINIYKDGQWGTYRHLLFDKSNSIEAKHCYLNSLVRGDLSSLKWIEGQFSSNDIKLEGPDEEIISVYYASLNFRDVMTATGKINVDTVTRERREQECVQGFEYSGRLANGKRVMGMVNNGACGSYCKGDKYLMWDVPEHWSLREAATVPITFATSIFALILKANIKPGDSILIHSGTGGVGQAAIQIALINGCTVYTTVGTQEKRDFIKSRFPQITDDHIFNSRDTSFEHSVMRATRGRGVDAVLNSLAEEKLMASVRCVAKGGHFLEIGKFDMGNNNSLSLLLLNKSVSFHGIMLDMFMKQDLYSRQELFTLVNKYLNGGHVKPLNSTVFHMNQAEEAFRYMTSGKHIGKVMFEIREEEKGIIVGHPSSALYSCIPRYYCDSKRTYIICGGLGGFGLELADWLVLRGCRNLVLTSRTGIKTGYQAYRISIWRSYGCNVSVFTDDITKESGCESLVKKASFLGPVHGIFNLAVILQDAIFTNQTEDMFKVSFGPKAKAAENLDIVTRKYCPELRDFVMFSSVSCGRGNAGQTNYGMANSIMERICEKRKTEGLPGLAIQWGAIGEVGLVADMQEESIEMEIGGTLQQRIVSCLEVMDLFLRQNESAVVASTVVAEKRSGPIADNIVSAVANILGIKDLKTISLQATLAEVGMDSMTAVEIKQTLEREFEVFLTPQDIKSMTFARLQEIQDERESLTSGEKKERALTGFEMIMGHLSDQSKSEIPILSLQGKQTNRSVAGKVILFGGIEGVIGGLQPLYEQLEGDLYGIQFCNNNQKDTIEDMALTYLETVEEKLFKSVPFKIVCYSFGGLVALQLVHELEKKGYHGTVVCIDAAPDYLQALSKILEVESDDKIQVSLLVHLMALRLPLDVVSKSWIPLSNCRNFDERLTLAEKIVTTENIPLSNMKEITISSYKRLKATVSWKPTFKLKSKVVLCKAKLSSVEVKDEDYGLGKISQYPVLVKEFDGNHVTVLENSDLANDINEKFWAENSPILEKEEPLIIIDQQKPKIFSQ
ncbi:fatty acid synthase-like [Sitophilus oryzae]|uniref:Fatty acid synthase-like n=2 Tax=Sitophilus oryzae TaxID=7048 RepID=A0A6J2XDH7_SITOR|nr:fatty acid synthase-like [Sitophilus oryzae]